jgi:DNA invertase Pin-like site-specific DNA recombinase
MAPLLIGHARVSTDEQDDRAARGAGGTRSQRRAHLRRPRPHRHQSRSDRSARRWPHAGRSGDTLVVTKLDRLARSLPDARDIVDELTHRHVKLSLGGSLHHPNDPVGRLLFNVLAMVAEFEADLIRMRTREGMRVAKAKGRLRGKQAKLNPRQEAHWSRCTEPANTAARSSATSSASPARPSTAPSNATRTASRR